MKVPRFVTVAQLDGKWGVGILVQSPDGHWWVDVKRTGLRYEDAADLRDVWNARGAEAR